VRAWTSEELDNVAGVPRRHHRQPKQNRNSMRHALSLASCLAVPLALAACSADDPPSSSAGTPSASPPAPPAETREATPTPSSTPRSNSVEGAVVRFSGGDVSVDVTIGGDNPATRDFVSMLPLTLTLEEFNGREKIGYLPRELDVAGAPGSDPEDGDLIYFVPWGNLGFYYNTEGVGYSDDTISIGTYTASEEQLERLETQDVTIELVEEPR
jgi:hypothetical protein